MTFRLRARLGFLSTLLSCLAAGVTPLRAVDHPPLSPERIQSLQERFGGVKAWQISFRYSAENPHAWNDGTQHNRTRWTESSQGSFILPTSEQDEFIIRISGTGRSTDAMDYYRVSRSSPVHEETRYDRASGVADVGVDITLYLETGVYDFSLIHNEIPDNYGGTIKDAFTSRTYENTGTTHVNAPTPAPADATLRLPEEGTTLTGSWSWEEEMEARKRHQPDFDVSEYAEKQQTRGRITWTITPADVEPLDVELIVEPQGYETWMPEGADGKNSGNQIALKATLVPLNGGKLKHKAKQITFTLADVSKEKGLALNAPKNDPSVAPDLGFEAGANGGAEVLGEGTGLRFVDGPYESVTANLSSYDWGAYGTVAVVARLDNGKTVQGKLRGAPGPDVLIPKRAPGSTIADAWKTLMGFNGSDGEDEDKQEGNLNFGDGLTAYEEYRGLMLEGRHTRGPRLLDPTKKDLVVINEIGPRAKRGLSLFESASGIHVVEAKPTDFLDSRQVNPNRGNASGGEQYGERLKQASLAGETAGENRPAHELNKTPRKSEEAVVDLALAESFYAEQRAIVEAAQEKMPYTLEEDIAQTIAHELAHGVGAPHHGKTTEYFGRREVNARMVDWKVFGINGYRVAVTADKPVQLTGRIGRPGNEASGDIGCIMAYANFYQWAAVGREGGPYTFFAVPPQPVGTRFCRDNAGTGYNVNRKIAGDIPIPGFFGPARGQGSQSPVGNCLGAMRVRDW